MKIYIPNTSKQSIGGGWTFIRNFRKGVSNVEFVDNWKECDIVLVTGVTMTDRKEMEEVKANGKKIILRIDNMPKDSRNRGTAFSRMLDFSKMADFFIFQSEWAKDYVGWWLVDNGVDITNRSAIVYNGVDREAFYPQEGEQVKGRYLYVQYNRDENKRMGEAFYLFHQAFRKDKSLELWLVGQFSPELSENNFDFFAGENVEYTGIIEDPKELGDIYRTCQYLLFPAFADASPNTVMEAMACGCEILGVNTIGGTIELMNIKGRSIEDMANEYKLIFEQVWQNNQR